MGKTRAKSSSQSTSSDSCWCIQLHGDAAFAGQGIVAETIQMSNLPGYSVQGTIHLIVNNQIGFTTQPIDGRSGLYASDIAKGINVPVIHVNGEDIQVRNFIG